MIPLNEAQTVLDRGDAAARTLADETFLSVVDDLSHHHLAGIASSPPGPKGHEAREYHHLMHYALSEIVGGLQGRVAAATELKQLIKLTDEAEED